VAIQNVEWSLIEHRADQAFEVPLSGYLGTRELPCTCRFGLVIDFTGTPSDGDTVSVEVLDSYNVSLSSKSDRIQETNEAGRAEVPFDVTFSQPGVYTVRVWRGDLLVDERALTVEK